MSIAKAQKIAEKETDAVIIAADLFVVHGKTILEKPKSLQEAQEMLQQLSGNEFQIVTGMTVLQASIGKQCTALETCTVRFRKLSENEISDYIRRYPVLKTAAAFEADGLLRFAEHIEGNYNFKAALPMNKLVEFLREFGIRV